ncbi:hypothetical protein ACWGDE_03735 [Streptomyces sp. NPDC054956]
MTGGLWDAGLNAWYGPATPVVRKFRAYRPNRRGDVKLVRWLRVLFIRALACVMAMCPLVLLAAVGNGLTVWQGALLCAGYLAFASLVWRLSLIRVVLRPGEIVRFGVWQRVIVPTAAVTRLHRETYRGGLRLETSGGETVDFPWFDGSLWDLLYDFSSVSEDAMRAHAVPRRGSRKGTRSGSRGTQNGPSFRVRRRFTRSIGSELLGVCAVGCVVLALVAALRG